jgi:hypothetical protein
VKNVLIRKRGKQAGTPAARLELHLLLGFAESMHATTAGSTGKLLAVRVATLASTT